MRHRTPVLVVLLTACGQLPNAASQQATTSAVQTTVEFELKQVP